MPDDDVFNDGSEIEVVCEPDDPPRSGEWVDSEEMIANPTEEELVLGEVVGQAIDVDNDEDNGGA